MTEIILGIIILSILGYHAWYVRESGIKEAQKEADYIKAILAKDLPEMVQAKITESAPEPEEDKPSEFVEVKDMTDKEFDEHIKKNQ